MAKEKDVFLSNLITTVTATTTITAADVIYNCLISLIDCEKFLLRFGGNPSLPYPLSLCGVKYIAAHVSPGTVIVSLPSMLVVVVLIFRGLCVYCE